MDKETFEEVKSDHAATAITPVIRKHCVRTIERLVYTLKEDSVLDEFKNLNIDMASDVNQEATKLVHHIKQIHQKYHTREHKTLSRHSL